QGFCIMSGSIDAPGTIDAPKAGSDGGSCPSPCTSCNLAQKTCAIDCSLTSCTGLVTCPTGYKCDVQCKTDNSCRNGVNCSPSTACTVECSGSGSCRNVMCGAGPCDVQCSGQNSCRGVTCGNSCACDVTCTATGACESVTCTSAACLGP